MRAERHCWSDVTNANSKSSDTETATKKTEHRALENGRITNRPYASRRAVAHPTVHRGIERVFHSSSGDRTMAMKKKGGAKKSAKKKGGAKKKAAKKK